MRDLYSAMLNLLNPPSAYCTWIQGMNNRCRKEKTDLHGVCVIPTADINNVRLRIRFCAT